MKKELKLFNISETITYTLHHEVVAHNEKEALRGLNEPSNFHDRWKYELDDACNYDPKFKIESVGAPSERELEDYEDNLRNANAHL